MVRKCIRGWTGNWEAVKENANVGIRERSRALGFLIREFLLFICAIATALLASLTGECAYLLRFRFYFCISGSTRASRIEDPERCRGLRDNIMIIVIRISLPLKG